MIIYDDGELELNVSVNDETVWLNRNQISQFFGRDVKTIGKYIGNVFSDGELDKLSVVANFATTAADGKTYHVEYYNKWKLSFGRSPMKGIPQKRLVSKKNSFLILHTLTLHVFQTHLQFYQH